MSSSSDLKAGIEHHEATVMVEGEKAIHVDIDDSYSNKRLVRKLDYHIVPWLFGIWLWAFIDRSNIGNARIDGLAKDLKLTGNKYNITLMVFYIPYILVDVPSNWIVKKIGCGWYLPILITCWGLTRYVEHRSISSIITD